jgi:hypothetical protein
MQGIEPLVRRFVIKNSVLLKYHAMLSEKFRRVATHLSQGFEVGRQRAAGLPGLLLKATDAGSLGALRRAI